MELSISFDFVRFFFDDLKRWSYHAYRHTLNSQFFEIVLSYIVYRTSPLKNIAITSSTDNRRQIATIYCQVRPGCYRKNGIAFKENYYTSTNITNEELEQKKFCRLIISLFIKKSGRENIIIATLFYIITLYVIFRLNSSREIETLFVTRSTSI